MTFRIQVACDTHPNAVREPISRLPDHRLMASLLHFPRAGSCQDAISSHHVFLMRFSDIDRVGGCTAVSVKFECDEIVVQKQMSFAEEASCLC